MKCKTEQSGQNFDKLKKLHKKSLKPLQRDPLNLKDPFQLVVP